MTTKNAFKIGDARLDVVKQPNYDDMKFYVKSSSNGSPKSVLSISGSNDKVTVDTTLVGAIESTSVDIDGGTIDGTDITVGAGKTLDVSAGTLTLEDDQISGDKIQGGTIGSTTVTNLTVGDITFTDNPQSKITATTADSVSSITIDPNPTGSNGVVIIEGSLTVKGTTTTVNSETVELEDNIIVLNKGETGAPSQDAGIEIERGTETNVSFLWDESAGKWTTGGKTIVANLEGTVIGDINGDITGDVTGNLTGNVTGNVEGDVTGTVSDISNHDTGDLTEGSNLYYTDARARAAVSVTDTGGDGSLTYNSGTGVITYTGPSAAETRAHFSGGTGVTITNGTVAIGQAVGTSDNVSFNKVTANLEGNVTGEVSTLDNHDTDSLSEGATNQYFTQARARGSVSVTDSGGDGSLSYNSGTGVITYTGPSAAETRAHFSGGTGVTITNGAVAIGQAVGTTDDVTFNTVSAALTGNVTGQVSTLDNHDTDSLSEGSTNLYYTDARARAAVSVTDSGGDGSLSYNSGTGVITYTGPSAAETRAHFSGGTGVTITNGAVAIGQAVATTDDVTFAKITSDHIKSDLFYQPLVSGASGTASTSGTTAYLLTIINAYADSSSILVGKLMIGIYDGTNSSSAAVCNFAKLSNELLTITVDIETNGGAGTIDINTSNNQATLTGNNANSKYVITVVPSINASLFS